MNDQTSSLKGKAFFQIIKRHFTNMGATIILFIGIAIMTVGIGGAVWSWLSIHIALLSISISFLGGSIGGFIFREALARFVFSPSGDKSKLEEEQRKNHDLSMALKEAEDNIIELQHQLNSSFSITSIKPVMKIIPIEVSYKYTDFYEKPLGEEHYRRPFSRKEHKDPVFYRGVIQSVGKLNVAVDLAKTKIVETADTFIICDPFEYETSVIHQENNWLMPGRREEESHYGSKKDDIFKIREIKVTDVHDTEGEREQEALLKKKIYNLDVVEGVKPFIDQIALDRVKLWLAPTGKKVIYRPTVNNVFSTKTLEEIEAAFNNRITALESLPAENQYLNSPSIMNRQ